MVLEDKPTFRLGDALKGTQRTQAINRGALKTNQLPLVSN